MSIEIKVPPLPESVSDATLKALKQMGLTEYETQAYLALVDGGQMAASDVSAKSKVPFSRIYDVLGRLEEKQFIHNRFLLHR